MKIKYAMQELIEKITNRRCKNCIYNYVVLCERTDKKGEKCRNSIFPYGYGRTQKGE